jgi:XTP/dITP diphosphohydrolase
MKKIVLATGNKGKVAEFSHLFAQYHIDVIEQSAFAVTDVAETGATFIENAIIKARHASESTGLPAIADDSGLVVNALNGAPGIYSARYAGEHGNDDANCEKLLDELNGEADRRAKFLCVLVFMKHANDPCPIICQGEWHGEIAQSRIGEGGFGYDPVFWLPNEDKSAAQLDKATKNAQSHRGKALTELMQKMQHLLA